MRYDENNIRLRWWLTALPLRFLGMNAEPYAILVFVPLFPFGWFISFVGWFLLMNLLLSWVVRKNISDLILFMRRLAEDGRRPLYSRRRMMRRYYDYH